MDIENMSIEKATERCNQLIKPEHANWIGISNQKAIETVLSELEKKDDIIDLMVEDFQNEGYLKGMSREEILDYYQKRLWLNKQINPLPLKLDITG